MEYRIVDEVLPSTHTTPDIITLNKILAQAVEKGCKYAFMEVSFARHPSRENQWLNFKVAGFTNLTHDHLDYHKTFWNTSIPKEILRLICQKLPLPSPILMIKTDW
ncbi:Mur ligase family protein [Bergeyella porcorum]|uniref:Mur ligase family protein n=1 Tax=Bergeyella porcorum TaxID=1735111 RepID=UPI00399C5A4C